MTYNNKAIEDVINSIDGEDDLIFRRLMMAGKARQWQQQSHKEANILFHLIPV